MPVAATKANTRPGQASNPINFDRAGDLVGRGQTSQISRQGTYKQPAALPGSATPHLPTTYKGTGQVEVDIPIKTIDVKATPIPNKQIGGTPERSSIPGTRPPRYSLPASSDRGVPLPDLKGLKSASGKAAGAATFLESFGDYNQRISDANQAAQQAKANDAKYGSGYSGRYVDDFNPIDPEFALDPKAIDRMGYRDYGDALKDAGATIWDAARNAANQIPPFPNPFAPQPNTSNPGQPAPGPEFAEPPAKPKLGLNLPLAPHGPEYQPYPPGGSAAPNSQSNRQNKFSDDPPVRPPGADPKRYPDVPPGDPIAILERPPSPPPIGTPQPLGTAQQYDIKVFPSNAPSLIYYQRRVTGPVTYTRLPNDGTPGPFYTDDNGQVQQSTMYSFSLSWPGGSTVHTGGNTVWSGTPVSPPSPGSNPGWQPTPSDPQAWPSTPPAPHIPASPSPSAPPVVGPQPSAQPNSAPQGDPQASPKNKPQAPTSPGEPAPNIPDPLPEFPDFMPQGLPSPQGSPGLPSPNLGPANPLTSGSPSSDPVSSPNFPSPTTSTTSSTSTKESGQPRGRFDGTPPPTPAPPTPDRCKDPCMNKILDNAELVTIAIQVFKECKDGEAVYETKQIQVIKGTEEFAKLQFKRIAEIEGQKCVLQDPNLVLPEWWQVRPGQRPQLVVVYGELKGQKLTTSRWSMAIPHYSRPKGYRPKIPSYTRGNWEGIYTLSDNSKLFVNASTQSECKKVINSLKLHIPPQLRKGATLKVGERNGVDYRNVAVVPVSAKFFSGGQRSTTPDWVVKLR